MGQANGQERIALIVEDDGDLRDLAAALMEETDLQVAEATSAEEALHILKTRADSVAFAFIDIRLPCLMDGVDLARTINIRWPWIRVLATSGDPGERLADLPRTARFVPKPWRALDVLIEAERAVR
ncbi:response regulator [Salinarimonas soli]|uniref:Response regulator n=1 Tax=Salinarimonas soli TaxID=1638099 RepID=A0A5B2VHY2_9HYPH|nr:response regulator [Salinarimonas soli]KAA2237949.1 response regulator [Salinarimonas soli]